MQVRTCPTCRGDGKIITEKCKVCNGRKVVAESKSITPTIPAGFENGTMFKIQGQGHIPSSNAVPGDLLVIVRIKRHPDFERNKTSLFSSASISFLQAITGSKINIKTIDGNVKLNIPSGTQSGTEFRLKGKGLPYYGRANLRGNHFVTVEVENPKYEKLPASAQKIIDELKQYIPPKNSTVQGKTSKKQKKR
jgi:molecular chaperone DnaJ